MSPKETTEEWLKSHGYDGLVSDQCGCFVGDDIMCCGSKDVNLADCKPGHKVPCDCKRPCRGGYHIREGPR